MKKGFTLVELLAVIVILAVILIIAIPQVLKAVDNSRNSAYTNQEQMIENVAKTYLAKNSGEAPNEIGETLFIDLGDLQEKNLIGEIRDASNQQIICEGYVAITKIDFNDYDYKSFINCGENYQTEGYAGIDFAYVDVLVVAGGGGGARTSSDTGGGGAGGLIFRPNYNIGEDLMFNVVVGNGGSYNNNGENSVFNSLVAIGGGSGSTTANNQTDGIAGGSGGGAGRNSGIGGDGLQPNQSGDSGLYGFGNRGGTNTGHIGTEGMGGGGAGEPGVDAIGILASIRHGGDGLYQVTPDDGPYDKIYNFKDMFGTQYGEIIDNEAWFAGGGGGGGERGTYTQNLGGRGGGGRGGHWNVEVSRNGYPGMVNTGGGGGGADNGTGGDGGSGIVIVRYPGPQKASGGIVYTFNGYTIHAFTELGGYTFEVFEF